MSLIEKTENYELHVSDYRRWLHEHHGKETDDNKDLLPDEGFGFLKALLGFTKRFIFNKCHAISEVGYSVQSPMTWTFSRPLWNVVGHPLR